MEEGKERIPLDKHQKDDIESQISKINTKFPELISTKYVSLPLPQFTHPKSSKSKKNSEKSAKTLDLFCFELNHVKMNTGLKILYHNNGLWNSIRKGNIYQINVGPERQQKCIIKGPKYSNININNPAEYETSKDNKNEGITEGKKIEESKETPNPSSGVTFDTHWLRPALDLLNVKNMEENGGQHNLVDVTVTKINDGVEFYFTYLPMYSLWLVLIYNTPYIITKSGKYCGEKVSENIKNVIDGVIALMIKLKLAKLLTEFELECGEAKKKTIGGVYLSQFSRGFGGIIFHKESKLLIDSLILHKPSDLKKSVKEFTAKYGLECTEVGNITNIKNDNELLKVISQIAKKCNSIGYEHGVGMRIGVQGEMGTLSAEIHFKEYRIMSRIKSFIHEQINLFNQNKKIITDEVFIEHQLKLNTPGISSQLPKEPKYYINLTLEIINQIPSSHPIIQSNFPSILLQNIKNQSEKEEERVNKLSNNNKRRGGIILLFTPKNYLLESTLKCMNQKYKVKQMEGDWTDINQTMKIRSIYGECRVLVSTQVPTILHLKSLLDKFYVFHVCILFSKSVIGVYRNLAWELNEQLKEIFPGRVSLFDQLHTIHVEKDGSFITDPVLGEEQFLLQFHAIYKKVNIKVRESKTLECEESKEQIEDIGEDNAMTKTPGSSKRSDTQELLELFRNYRKIEIEEESKINEKNLPSAKTGNLIIIAPIGIPGMGKTTLFDKIHEEIFTSVPGKYNFTIHRLSIDQIRAKEIENILNKFPDTPREECFQRVAKIVRYKYKEELEEITTKCKEGNNIMILDKNHAPNNIKGAYQDILKPLPECINSKLIALIPHTDTPFTYSPPKSKKLLISLPFSLNFILISIKRMILRTNHLTMIEESEEIDKLKIIFEFIQCFNGFKLNSSRLNKFGWNYIIPIQMCEELDLNIKNNLPSGNIENLKKIFINTILSNRYSFKDNINEFWGEYLSIESSINIKYELNNSVDIIINNCKELFERIEQGKNEDDANVENRENVKCLALILEGDEKHLINIMKGHIIKAIQTISERFAEITANLGNILEYLQYIYTKEENVESSSYTTPYPFISKLLINNMGREALINNDIYKTFRPNLELEIYIRAYIYTPNIGIFSVCSHTHKLPRDLEIPIIPLLISHEALTNAGRSGVNVKDYIYDRCQSIANGVFGPQGIIHNLWKTAYFEGPLTTYAECLKVRLYGDVIPVYVWKSKGEIKFLSSTTYII